MTAASTSHLHHSGHHHQQLAEIEPRPAIFRSWERVRQRRAQWLVECIAEMVSLLESLSSLLGLIRSVPNAYSSEFSAIVTQVSAPQPLI